MDTSHIARFIGRRGVTALAALSALGLTGIAAPKCAAANLYVSPSGSDDNDGSASAPFQTIQAAVDSAVGGDTVTLEDGTYSGDGNRDIDFGGANITLTSAHGASATVIDCGGSDSANHRGFFFHTNETADISGVTVENGHEATASGGALYVAAGSTVTLTGCNFHNNVGNAGFGGVAGGGAIYNAGTAQVTDCVLNANTAYFGGGVFNTGTLMMAGCTVNGNIADSARGGVYNTGIATFAGCLISGNTALDGSGGLENSGTLTMTDCTVTANTCAFAGGGMFTSGTTTLTRCTVSGNSGGEGGGIYAAAPQLTMTDCTVSGNTSNGGGGLFNGGVAVLTGCLISGNVAVGNEGNVGNGGGVYNTDQTTLTNCVLSGNTSQIGNGGGAYNPAPNQYTDHFLRLQSCSVVGNSATGFQTQGGALENDGRVILSDDILWGNTAPAASEIGNATSGDVVNTVTYCDIQGGLRGTGNINADPLFLNANAGDLRPTASSPCLGAGTAAGEPAADKNGYPRPATPSIGAYEYTALPSAWSAISTSTGADGGTRILWNNVDGTATVWTLDASNGFAGQHQFGPYAGWTARAVAGSSDAETKLLWTRTDGAASFYLLDALGRLASQQQYGPYVGWTAQGLAAAPDNTVRALWTNTDGTATVWTLDGTNHLTGQQQYGPYPGWTARSLSVGNDFTERLLWTKTDGTAALWLLDGNSRMLGQQQYGPYVGYTTQSIYTAQSIAAVPDGTARVVWTATDGHIALWTIDADNIYTGQSQYGPYAGWSFTGIGVDTDGNARLLWDDISGQAALWSLTPGGAFATNYQFGPY
jgi:hypothetical protein